MTELLPLKVYPVPLIIYMYRLALSTGEQKNKQTSKHSYRRKVQKSIYQH